MCLYILYILGLKTKEEDEIFGTEGSLLWKRSFDAISLLQDGIWCRRQKRERNLLLIYS